VIQALVILAAITVLSTGWHSFLYKLSGRGRWNPLRMAFSLTAGAAIYVAAGVIGYTLDRHDRFVAHTAWAGHVLWPEIAIGAAFGLGALVFWRKGLETL
jgi:hypothetical protein